MKGAVRTVRALATAKATVGLACVGAMCVSGRIGDLNGDPNRFGLAFELERAQSSGVPLALPCGMATLWALRGFWLAAGSVRGVRWSWGLVLVLGACHWVRAPLLRVAFDLEQTGDVSTWLYAVLVGVEGFAVERFLPLALCLVVVPSWSLVFRGRSYPITWALPAICLAVPVAVELGVLPEWSYWLACLAPVPVLLSGVRRPTELVRASCLWIAGFCLALSIGFVNGAVALVAPIFASVALVAFTPFPRNTAS